MVARLHAIVARTCSRCSFALMVCLSLSFRGQSKFEVKPGVRQEFLEHMQFADRAMRHAADLSRKAAAAYEE